MSAVLDRVRSYRQAARAAVEADDKPFRNRCIALMRLAEAARAEPDATVSWWAQVAIWSESAPFLEMEDEPLTRPEVYEGAQRRLRSMGYQDCPECHARLSTEEQLARWARLRIDEAGERDRRKEALA